MSLIKANGAGEVSTGFYKGVATQSLRFNDGDPASLSWTPSSAGNRKKWTFSTWLKRSTITNASSGDQYIFSQTTGTNNNDSFIGLIFRGDDLDVTCNSIELLRSNAVFRDNSAWYHILWVLDTENATDAHKMRLYVNNDEITSFSTDNRSNAVLDGTNMPILNNAIHYIGSNSGSSLNFDGYLAFTELVEGEALTPSSFTETKNNILIPKKYTGDHGTYGFRLEYKETGDGSSSASSSTIGADTKSNGTKQHWNDNNLDAYDSNMPDSPENNFPTINSLVQTNGASASTYTNGNLLIVKTGTTYSYFQSTFGVKTGKWYAECRLDSTINTFMVGITEQNMETYRTGDSVDPHTTAGTAWYGEGGYGYFDGSSISAGTFSSSTSFGDGDVIGLALDLDSSTKTIKWYKNGSLAASKDLTANFVDHIVFANNLYNTNTAIWNFGQDSTFGGHETVATNSDGNGIGEFHESVPSGYLALCSSNLDDDNYATIGPTADNNTTDFHTTTYYAGNNDATRTFDLGFVSDWAWFKGDSSGYGHQMYDSSRGVQKYLRSNTTGTEVTNSEGVLDFDDSGNLLKIGTDAFLNESGTSVSLWTWRINGGTTATNSNGSADSTVQVNTTVGMSQVLYTGNATGAGAEQTIGHGLGVKPDVIMFKSRTYASQNWYIHHIGLANGVTTHVELDTNDLEHGDADYMNEVAPTASVFSLGYNFTTNKSGESYIAYCFKSVEGYSKYGSFTGNGSTNGAYVYLGFRPQLIIAKCRSHSSSWHMVDATRDYNPIGYYNTDNADAYGDYAHYDILSNGFKVRDNGTESNRSGGTFIYMAWANSPFKYANAR